MKKVTTDIEVLFTASQGRTFQIGPDQPVFMRDDEAQLIQDRLGSHVLISEMTMEELQTLTPDPAPEETKETSDAPENAPAEAPTPTETQTPEAPTPEQAPVSDPAPETPAGSPAPEVSSEGSSSEPAPQESVAQ